MRCKKRTARVSVALMAILLPGSVVLGDDPVDGDFNSSGQRDVEDIDLLGAAMRSGNYDEQFDLNGDGTLDFDDRRVWVQQLSNTYMGDSNFDGSFDSGDFVHIWKAAKYEKQEPAGWGDGDWNGDGFFNSSDFCAAFGCGSGYENGPREGGLQVVPKPSNQISILAAVAILFGTRRPRTGEAATI